MNNYRIESWLWSDPNNRDHSTCATWEEANALALALQSEGFDVAVYRLDASYMAAPLTPSDLAAFNGVRPGVDFPATLGGRRYTA